MNLREHEKRDDMKVWLSEQEVETLLDATSDTEHYLAYTLGLRCGLRSQKMLNVAPSHVVETDAGYMPRVWENKRNQYHGTPVPLGLVVRVRRSRTCKLPRVANRYWIAQPGHSGAGCLTSARNSPRARKMPAGRT